jgi:mono/diheme cytochrome c family protein
MPTILDTTHAAGDGIDSMPNFAPPERIRLIPSVDRTGFATRHTAWLAIAVAVSALMPVPNVAVAADPVAERFGEKVQPILAEYCLGCHGNGSKKGGVDLDGLEGNGVRLRDHELWLRVLRNVRAGIMPPAEKPRPSEDERRRLEEWIKYAAFGIDPVDPDPGRVTVRRLYRVEYKNTIHDLIGVDYDASSEFPSDDTGHGFDNNGDVLTLSPLLLEKYLIAANAIVSRAVPLVPLVMAERVVPGRSFQKSGGGQAGDGPVSLSYYEPATVSAATRVDYDGRYRVIFDLTANERYVDGQNDYNRCRVVLGADGEELMRREFVRQDGKPFHFEFDRDWKAGPHTLAVEVQPLTSDQKKVRSLSIRVQSATLRGPADERYWVRPSEYERFFPGEVPGDPAGRERYTRVILGRFAERAFRRPVDDATKDRLAALVGTFTAGGGRTFEAGVA